MIFPLNAPRRGNLANNGIGEVWSQREDPDPVYISRVPEHCHTAPVSRPSVVRSSFLIACPNFPDYTLSLSASSILDVSQ